MSYTVKPDPGFPESVALFENEKPKCCPFHPPMTSPGKLQGQVNLIYRNCGTLCALFELKKRKATAVENANGFLNSKEIYTEQPDKIESVVLHCAGKPVEYFIKESAVTPENTLKLL